MIMMPFCAYPHLQSTMVDRSNIMTMDNGHEHADRSAHDAFTYLTPANLQSISGPRDLNISRPQCLSNSDGRVAQKHGRYCLFLTKVTMRRYPDMIMFEEIKKVHCYYSSRNMLMWAIGACPSKSDKKQSTDFPKKTPMDPSKDKLT